MDKAQLIVLACACMAAIEGAAAVASAPGGAEKRLPTVYYLDGYHGGVRGHVPAGAWRDILNRLRTIPTWKISLDIEPESLEALRRTDPEVFLEFERLLGDHSPAARVEMAFFRYCRPPSQNFRKLCSAWLAREWYAAAVCPRQAKPAQSKTHQQVNRSRKTKPRLNLPFFFLRASSHRTTICRF